LVRLLAQRGLAFPGAVVTCNRRAADFSDEFEINCNLGARPVLTEILTGLLDRPFWVHESPWRITDDEMGRVVDAERMSRTQRRERSQ
jgi:hypothetical protein